jgi:hypothetical protein
VVTVTNNMMPNVVDMVAVLTTMAHPLPTKRMQSSYVNATCCVRVGSFI